MAKDPVAIGGQFLVATDNLPVHCANTDVAEHVARLHAPLTSLTERAWRRLALSRLLNSTDGLSEHGKQTLVLITTNRPATNSTPL